MSLRLSKVFALAGVALLAACAAPIEQPPAAAAVAPAIVAAEPVFTGKL